MGRSTAIVFVVLGAALAGLAFSSAAGRFQKDAAPAAPSIAAGPQNAELNWRETYGRPGEQLVFEVERLVLARVARVARAHERHVGRVRGGRPAGHTRSGAGLMLFRSGDTAELERRNANGCSGHACGGALRAEPEVPSRAHPRGDCPAGRPVASWARVV
jgi:hypothetical protein